MASEVPLDNSSQQLLQSISNAGEDLRAGRAGAREQLLALSHSLTASLELPSEALQRIGWAEPARFALCRLAIDRGLFEILVSEGSRSVTTDELAKRGQLDIVLASRCMKHLAAMGIVKEEGPDRYLASSLTKALTEPKYRDGLIYLHDVAGPCFHDLPTYLKSIDYRCPTSIVDGPFQYAHKTKAPFFQWLAENPPYMAHFANYMGGYRAGKPTWLDPNFYPFESQVLKTFEPGHSEVLLVDIGGGQGHDLQVLHDKFEKLPGKLVLEDLPDVIKQVPSTSSFETIPHDFFTPQPIQGAKAYYLHSVLHDWDDETCQKILRQIIPALKKGYSKILINELVVPDFDATWSITSMDMLMLVLGAVRERTEKHWRELLGSVGLKITKIYTYEQGTESLIEAELV